MYNNIFFVYNYFIILFSFMSLQINFFKYAFFLLIISNLSFFWVKFITIFEHLIYFSLYNLYIFFFSISFCSKKHNNFLYYILKKNLFMYYSYFSINFIFYHWSIISTIIKICICRKIIFIINWIILFFTMWFCFICCGYG